MTSEESFDEEGSEKRRECWEKKRWRVGRERTQEDTLREGDRKKKRKLEEEIIMRNRTVKRNI